MNWSVVIGLEIHAQLATDSKMFSGAATRFGAEPNTQASPVDLGMPGVLPVPNLAAVRLAVRFALATGGEIATRSIFARKNYFYPDLPKGYQISQFERPIVSGGAIDIELASGQVKRIALTRAHLEEDAGRSVHDLFEGRTAIDLNRAGTPLLEIVSEPELESAAEAAAYARRVHELVRWIGVCDGNMQEGSFRCDANVSVRQGRDAPLGTRTEIKNLNSFRFLERAIEIEVERQVERLEAGGEIVQETRLYDAAKDETRAMRTKEEANDYRYFPDPDLPPVIVDAALIESVRQALPELPDARRRRLRDAHDLSPNDAAALTADRATADYFDALIAAGAPPRLAGTWLLGEVFARLNRDGIALEQSPVSAERLARLLVRIDDGTVSGAGARTVLDRLWTESLDADTVIEADGLRQISDDTALERIVDEIVAANPGQVAQYRAGKTKLLGFFVGQAMKASGGKANPAALNERFRERLEQAE